MMSKMTFCFFLAFPFLYSYPQSHQEYVNSIVSKFQNCFNSIADTSKNQTAKNKAMAELVPYFESTSVPFWNIFDESGISYLPVKEFVSVFISEVKIGKTETKINSYGKPELKKERHAYLAETNLLFTITTPLSTDSTATNNYSETSYEITLYLKFEKEGLIFKNPKIISVANPKKPEFNDLSENIKWWINLEKEWKGVFTKTLNLSELPSELDIKNIFYLFELDLSETQFSSYQPLEKLTELRKLKLKKSAFSNSNNLRNCTYLGELDLSDSQVKEINGLSQLKSMRKLYLNNLQLEDISALKDMSKLIELEINENKIKDLEPLKNLSNLEKLQCSINELSNIEPLSACVKLTDIRMGKNQIESLAPLQQIPDLVRIDAFNNKIKDLAPLRNCKKLAWLHIDFNPVTNLEPISNLGYLIYLSMAHTLVKDLSPLKNLTILDKLNIAGTEISSLGPVKKIRTLSELKMFNTRISKGEAADYKKANPRCSITYY